MTYRIRYRRPDAAADREIVVEANSPMEAMVKFRCTQQAQTDPDCLYQVVTSVRADDAGQDICW